jgi:hypothetical protein
MNLTLIFGFSFLLGFAFSIQKTLVDPLNDGKNHFRFFYFHNLKMMFDLSDLLMTTSTTHMTDYIHIYLLV